MHAESSALFGQREWEWKFDLFSWTVQTIRDPSSNNFYSPQIPLTDDGLCPSSVGCSTSRFFPPLEFKVYRELLHRTTSSRQVVAFVSTKPNRTLVKRPE